MARRQGLWGINLRIGAVVLGTIGLYTLVANTIPQIESEVPEELSFTGEITPEQLIEAGQELYEGAGGCTACHGLGTRAPNLLAGQATEGPIGARCAQRVQGMACKEYLYQSMTEPNEHVVEGFQPIMPDMRRTLSNEQIWALIAYLESQGGEVTVTAADISRTAEAPPPGGAAAGGAPAGSAPGSATTDPMALFQEFGCLACHKLGDQGQVVGPPFDGIGARRDAAYIRRSILDPATDVPEGFEQLAGVMPRDFGQRMTAAQLESIVQFLSEQR
ncbi:MAG: c-type cytochrome [Gemmatimonadota bacterium]